MNGDVSDGSHFRVMNQGWQSGLLSEGACAKFGDLSSLPGTYVLEGEN